MTVIHTLLSTKASTITLIIVASITCLATYASVILAGITPKVYGWQERDEPPYKTNWPWIIVTSGLAIITGIAWNGTLGHVLLIGWVTATLQYICLTDFRVRWIPEHAIIPIILAGLELTPIVPVNERINGMLIAIIAMYGWQVVSSLAATRTIDPDHFNGGEITIAAAIGAWLGPEMAIKTLCLGLILLLVTMIVTKPRTDSAPLNRLQTAMGYRPDDSTMPAGPYFLASFWISMLLAYHPGLK